MYDFLISDKHKKQFFYQFIWYFKFFVVNLQPKRNLIIMSKGQYAIASPELTGLMEGVKGEVINVRQNPFVGQEIAIRDASGRVFFGESKYFTSVQ